MAIIKILSILVGMIIDITPYVYLTEVNKDRKEIKQLITQCMSAIYGTMVESLLYYFRFYKTLKLNKPKMNPYYTCVANRLVN